MLLLVVVIVARMWGSARRSSRHRPPPPAIPITSCGPAGFWIEDPNDWVAFITFIVTAVIAGELSARAERRAAGGAGRAPGDRAALSGAAAAFDRASEAEAARRNEQLKAALLDALTHNLRTPLTAIKAAVTALIGAGSGIDGSALSSEGRRELLEVIDEESDRLNRFIEGLSTPDRIDGAQPSTLRSARLDDIVRAGAGARRNGHAATTASSVDVDEALPAVSVDPASIAEVVYILLDNASKYAPPARRIAIRGGGGRRPARPD